MSTGPSKQQGDRSQALLELIHQQGLCPVGSQPDLTTLLTSLVETAQAGGAGLVTYPQQKHGLRVPPSPQGLDDVTWLQESGWAACALQSSSAIVLERSTGQSDLVTYLRAGTDTWLLWLEPHTDRPAWTEAEAAALSLVALAWGRLLETSKPRWAEQILTLAGRQQMEMAATVSRRLAHDFGNILTGILGFTELALSQQTPSSSSLHGYLSEVYRAAQSGAQFTNHLRLFSTRQPLSSRNSDLGKVLQELLETRFADRPAELSLRAEVPESLPPVAVETEPLRHILTELLENSQEAIVDSGAINIFARVIDVNASDATLFFGDLRPGPHVDVTITDTGTGLSPEAMQQLFVEPFFSTKGRRRGGFGLATTYGLLCAHKGGLRLFPGEERGVVARVLLPIAHPEPALRNEIPAAAAASVKTNTGEPVLVVEDDPEVLRFVVATLRRAGFQPAGFLDAQEALQDYFARGPYRLVITDVLMQPVNGVEFARRLLRRDPLAQLLFMSGQVTPDFTQSELALKSFEFLAKPFRPEQLVQLVQSSLERAPRSSATLSGSA
jgi:signal transduction histidine kinase/ActR/RegA family two-component response regulator